MTSPEDVAAAVSAVRRGAGTVSVVARVAGEETARVSVEPDAQHYSASTMSCRSSWPPTASPSAVSSTWTDP